MCVIAYSSSVRLDVLNYRHMYNYINKVGYIC